MKKIMFATSEAYPFLKTGGLGDVAFALPKELNKNGYETRVICPLYQDIKDEYKNKMKKICDFSVPVGWRNQYCGLLTATLGNTIFYFIDNEYYFKRGGAYGYYDDGERFAFFDRAILEAILHIEDFAPDIIHCNDWHTGLVPVLMHHYYYGTKAFCKVVYSIHNLKFQGMFPKQILTELLNLNDGYYTDDKLKFYDCISFMKGGIVYSDFVNTVSPTYAEEIQGEYYGEGLDGVLRANNYKLKGILNGIDYDIYDPKTDKALYENFSSAKFDKKKINKTRLQQDLGLAVSEDIPMIGIISRMTPQKGFDLVIAVLEQIMNNNVQLVMLGTGDAKYEEVFKYFAHKYPDRMSVNITFSDDLARKIYAASDLFLMPSLFEPCGLGQLMALRYGSIPVVRETGGLRDTVTPYNEFTGKGNGFSFANFNAHEMLHVIEYALSQYHNKDAWNKLVRNAMRSKFDWSVAAKNYIDVYENL